MKYKVLSMWEPWATLYVHGIKKIETRPKPTSWTIEKGSYLIHAAKKWTKEQEQISITEPFLSELSKLNRIAEFIHPDTGEELPTAYFLRGYIIGAVDVIECCHIFHIHNKRAFIYPNIKQFRLLLSEFFFENENGEFEISENEFEFGDYREGRYAWITRNPRILKTPIPYKGGQGYYQNFKGDENQLIFK